MSGFESNHLTAEEVAAYTDGDVTAEERSRVEGHVARCRTCLDEVAAVEALVRSSPAAEGWAGGWRRPALIASAAAAAVLLLFLVPGAPEPRMDQLRGPDREVPAAAPALEVYAPPTEVRAGSEVVLRWEAPAQETVYRVAVMDSVGRILWTEETRESSARLPREIRDELRPGARYFWRADALLSDLRTLSTGDRSFRIRP